MSEDKDKTAGISEFAQKASRAKPADAPKSLAALQALREEAQKNGLSADTAQEILDEYYAEKYGKKGKEKGDA